MALEMVVLESRESRRAWEIRVLHFFDVEDQVSVGGQPLVAQTADELPDLRGLVLPAALSDAINDGSKGFQVVRLRVTLDTSGARVLQMLCDCYASRAAAFNAAYQEKFGYVGTVVNAP